MPRHPRLFVPGAIYHVYCRVARGEFIFDDHDEAIEFIEHLRTVRDLDRWTVFAWCLMGNHYHLVLKTDDISLWRSMARLQGSFSRNYNRRHRLLGRLWQSRYRARVIDTEEYFRQVVAYVHLNPVAAGLVDDPANHLFSGHRELIGICQPHVVDRQATFEASEPQAIQALPKTTCSGSEKLRRHAHTPRMCRTSHGGNLRETTKRSRAWTDTRRQRPSTVAACAKTAPNSSWRNSSVD